MFYMVQAKAVEFCNVIIVERIVDLTSILAAAEKAHLAQSSQLVGNRRFCHDESRGDIANIHFPVEQHRNNPQTGWVTESAK